MTAYVGLLRAVNVGGTGKLPMSQLKACCEELGFRRVETCIASGNVVFDAEATAEAVRVQLAHRLQVFAGRPVGVFVRTAAEMQRVLADNPFADRPGNLTYAFFLDDVATPTMLREVLGLADELISFGRRELYVFYPAGMGRSKLQIPAAKHGTARNLNTVAKLAAMSSRT